MELLVAPGLVPMLEQQLRRSLCCDDEGPDNEETVTDVELAPAEAEEDGNACNIEGNVNIYWFIMVQYN